MGVINFYKMNTATTRLRNLESLPTLRDFEEEMKEVRLIHHPNLIALETMDLSFDSTDILDDSPSYHEAPKKHHGIQRKLTPYYRIEEDQPHESLIDQIMKDALKWVKQ